MLCFHCCGAKKVVPAVKSHLDKVLSTKPQSVDLIKELLLETDEQELQRRIDVAHAAAKGTAGVPSTSSGGTCHANAQSMSSCLLFCCWLFVVVVRSIASYCPHSTSFRRWRWCGTNRSWGDISRRGNIHSQGNEWKSCSVNSS
jgi:hypothetical protein